MLCHVRHPFNLLQCFMLLGIFFHASALASPQELQQPSEALGVSHYIRLFHNADTLTNTELVSQFYRERAYQSNWVESGQARAKADELRTVLKTAYQQGLVLPGYYLETIESLSYSQENRDRAWLDIILTDAFISYALRAGRGQLDPGTLQENWNYNLPEVDALYQLQQALAFNNVTGVLQGLLPQQAGYRRLVEALDFYTVIERKGGWPQIAIYGPSLKKGMQSEEIIILRDRLIVTGDLPENAARHASFDHELEAAVKHFQQRHGIDADGVVGQETRFALHAPVEKRIQQITANLERWRWLPRDMGERHIRVNTAAFELQAVERDRTVLSMRVVVGKTKNKTPSFSEDMQYLVVNPYWYVPNKIARDELIKKERARPGYLARKNIKVLSGAQVLNPSSVNWTAFRGMRQLPVRLRQEPGGKNALGNIKFIFPNRFSIYLHDTPSKSFFEKTRRTFSHGCVRVQNPLALADYVLGDDWQAGDIQQLIDGGKNRRIQLPKPLPVHIVYQTAWVNDTGEINFRKDLYRNDRQIMARLPAARPAVQTAVASYADDPQPLSQLDIASDDKVLVN